MFDTSYEDRLDFALSRFLSSDRRSVMAIAETGALNIDECWEVSNLADSYEVCPADLTEYVLLTCREEISRLS